MSVLICSHAFIAQATDIKLQPTLSASYINVLDSEFSGIQFSKPIEDGHQVMTLSPELSMLATGPVWNGNWTVAHTRIQQFDSDYDNTRFTNLILDNEFSFAKDRVVFFANGSSQNQNINRDFAGVSDPIFGQEEYIDVESISAGVTFKTSPAVDWRTQLSFSTTETDFDEDELEETATQSTQLLRGNQQQAQLSLGYGRNAQQARVNVVLSASKNDTEQRGLQKFVTASANIGFPVWRSLDVVLTALKTENQVDNSRFNQNQLDNENIGAGIAWRFGNRSYIEVTRNKETRSSQLVDDSEGTNDEFTAYSLVLAPNDNNQLSYSKSRRFYGDSHTFQLTKNAKRWDINASYNESLQTRTRLQTEVIPAGVFECPSADGIREECSEFDVTTDPFNEDLFYFNFNDVDYFFTEELTLNKGGQLAFNYRFKKSSFTASVSKSTREFLEREEVSINNEQKSRSVSLSFDHQLNRRTTLNLLANRTETLNADDSIQRKGAQYSISLERRMTRKATGTLGLRRFENEDGRSGRERKDNRIEVTYKYAF